MLLAILLLLVAVGLLIAALVTGQIGLAWGSVGVSASVVLVLLALRRRWRRRGQVAYPVPGTTSDAAASDSAGASGDEQQDGSAAGDRALGAVAPSPAPVPDEEDTDAADLQVVREIQDDVLVVDEHPRYHLAHCEWPDPIRAERLPVQEARELGFTPCARCRPDATLARRHRATSTT